VVGGIDKVIPVDVYVPGCPAKPEAIIDGVILALEKLKERRDKAGHEQETIEDLQKVRGFYANRSERQVEK
jgi:NADH:ubiquinone oxidoreductase subunit B-like Fe-S oxidoreductase